MFFRRGSQSVARSQHLIRIPIVRGMLKRLRRRAIYSFCITLMCCRRTAVAGSRNLSARSASSR